MPPSNPPPVDLQEFITPKTQKPSAGPIVGIIIIVLLLVVGALYFWGAYLNSQNTPDELPLIPGDDSTAQ
ncbi:MAG: hypothetical protein A2854_04340 [Parcubacteria group bacterium RIFCSPHIGHO2_01_FULL_56_18]|nr:MAG: hypothetical protein A2854_04340 [Parcubacteria group bacterium RIFCSPHIGHO2_01_FULL_56_18]